MGHFYGVRLLLLLLHFVAPRLYVSLPPIFLLDKFIDSAVIRVLSQSVLPKTQMKLEKRPSSHVHLDFIRFEVGWIDYLWFQPGMKFCW